MEHKHTTKKKNYQTAKDELMKENNRELKKRKRKTENK